MLIKYRGLCGARLICINLPIVGNWQMAMEMHAHHIVWHSCIINSYIIGNIIVKQIVTLVFNLITNIIVTGSGRYILLENMNLYFCDTENSF